MKSKGSILIIENNSSVRQLMEKVLAEYTLTFSATLSDAFKNLQQYSYDLIIVSICQGYEDVYKKTEQFSVDKNITIPILYLSCDGVDLHNVGIEYCNVESITEPYGIELFKNMLDHTLVEHRTKQREKQREEKKHQEEISEVAEAMLSLQNDNAKLYDISRFLQRSFFCKDVQALCEQLFIVTRSFNTSCTLSVHSEKHDFYLSDGIINGEKINRDILKMAKDEARIFQFGNDRAIFNWGCASLLVTQLGSDVDNLALLMDGFEMGFNAIESVEEFNDTINAFNEHNFELKVQVARVVEDVATNITDELSQLGATAMLTVEQEDSLVNLAEQARKEVDTLFNEGLQMDVELSRIMTKMRTQTDQQDNVDDSAGDDDGIDFF